MKEISKLSQFIKKGSKIIEPFLGSGTVSMELGGPGSIGNDLSKEIYSIWEYCENPIWLENVRILHQEENRYPEYYYPLRDRYNEKWKNDIWDLERSYLFYYLLNSCHGAMIRYGPNGFNVGYKLFLSNGRKYHIESRIKSLHYIKGNMEEIQNKDVFQFLKDLEPNINDFDIIYCDPPYINSDLMYIGGWTRDNLSELDDLLYYFNQKYDVPAVLSNYYADDFSYKGDEFIHETSRMVNTKRFTKTDVIVTYGKQETGMEKFFG